MTNRCPALIDLTASELGSEIEAHLRTCRRCQALRAALPTHEGESSASVTPASTRELRRRPSTGDFGLLTTFDAQDNLVVFVAAVRNGEAIVVPISDETRFATEWDLLIDEDVLGYPAMAEAWNHGVVLVEQLSEALLSAPPQFRSDIPALVEATKSNQLPSGLRVGAPVLSQEDPRLAFEEEEAEVARCYWYPRMLLAGVSTVGELVSRRQAELGLPDDDLEPLSDRSSWLNDVRHSRRLREDEHALVLLLRALQIRGSERLRTLLINTVEQQHRLSHVQAGVAFSRRRAGTSGAGALDREKLRRAEIEAFASRVVSQLDEP